ncbi:hypothetical protein DY000_02017998 [Brassica cretica]|uniref:Uncharacterized protein n=1 Tax=Brassica cretica TaxID=69181 RepID=A0ABQ7CL63_BRACR|nr:hypothetical protein DY000_02017998 [Brassica cretica]
MIRKDVVTLTFRALTEKRNREKCDKLCLSLELGSFAAGVMNSTTDLAQHTLEQVLMKIGVPRACTAKACASRGSGLGSTSRDCIPRGPVLPRPALNVYRGGAGQVGIPSAVNEMVASRLVEFPEDLVEEMSMTLPDMMFVDGQEPVEVRVLRA